MKTVKSAKRLEHVTFSPVRMVLEKAKAMEAEGKSVIHFEIGEPDFNTPEAIKLRTKEALDSDLTHYAPNRGVKELRDEIVNFLKHDYGVTYRTEDILVTCGAAEAIYDVMVAYLDPNDEIILPLPAYMNYRNVAHMCGANVIDVPFLYDRDIQLDIPAIEDKISSKTKMIVLNNPSNPTGLLYNYETLEAIAELAVRHDLLILADEIYSELLYDKEFVSMASFPEVFDRTFIVSGFSKSLAMTGWRVGFVASPPDLYLPVLKVHQYVTTCCPTFIQSGLAESLKNGECSSDKLVMRDIFKQRRDFITSALDEMKSISYIQPDGAFYVYIDISKTGMSNEAFAEALLDSEGLAVVPGSCFDPQDNDNIRLSYAASEKDIEEGMKRLSRFVSNL